MTVVSLLNPTGKSQTPSGSGGYQVFIDEQSPVIELSGEYGGSFDSFRQSWDDLRADSYLESEEKYRFRRYSVFDYVAGQLAVLPHEPHYQEKHFNALYGGIERHYLPWLTATQKNRYFQRLLAWIEERLPESNPGYRVQGHQFRVFADSKSTGQPSPEGIHKDGSDYTLILLMKLHNTLGGVSRIYDNNKQLIQQLTLKNTGDCIFIDDKACYHNTTSIQPKDTSCAAYRDVLVLTFHANS